MLFKDKFKSREEYNEYFRKYREKNRNKIRVYNREYNKIWRSKNGFHNEYNSKKKYPEKECARRLLNRAIKYGKIVRENCEICDSPKSQGHHEDYFKPLEVQWFCALHHRQFHKHDGDVHTSSLHSVL